MIVLEVNSASWVDDSVLCGIMVGTYVTSAESFPGLAPADLVPRAGYGSAGRDAGGVG